MISYKPSNWWFPLFGNPLPVHFTPYPSQQVVAPHLPHPQGQRRPRLRLPPSRRLVEIRPGLVPFRLVLAHCPMPVWKVTKSGASRPDGSREVHSCGNFISAIQTFAFWPWDSFCFPSARLWTSLSGFEKKFPGPSHGHPEGVPVQIRGFDGSLIHVQQMTKRKEVHSQSP